MITLTDIKQRSIEVLPGKLYFYSHKVQPKVNIEGAYILNFDKKYAYKAINKDFGPINIGDITNYCREMEDVLRNNARGLRKFGQPSDIIVHHCNVNPKTLVNQAILICSFLLNCF